jgi:hypothetical protein
MLSWRPESGPKGGRHKSGRRVRLAGTAPAGAPACRTNTKGNIVKASVKFVAIAGLSTVAMVIYAATALQFGRVVNVSQTPTPTEKAKVVRLAYQQGAAFKKAWLVTYADGPSGRQDVFARYSFDDGTTWSAPVLLSRDAANAPTGGQQITTKGSLVFSVDNGKPTIMAPPTTSGPMAVITWNSAYCPQNPAATDNAGSYVNPQQGAGDFDEDGTPDRPFHCVWVATTTDPTLAAWNVQQITNGTRDAINEVLGGNATGTAFAMAWQEDPNGLRPGEAEGRGDGGSGSVVSGGTNIWYSHAPSPSGATLRANVAQLSDNQPQGLGQPGASRPNLQISGSTAVVAYEESACPGGTGGRCVIYHSFPYASHDTVHPGTIVSDVTKNARRVRFILQGAAGAGASSLRTLLLWRESPFITPGAPADIVVRRGLAEPHLRPGSTGFLPSDILADAQQNLTNVARSGGDANAHRAILRGNVAIVAYDFTRSMEGANPEQTNPPTTNYNFFITRSVQGGEAGSWSKAINLSGIDHPTLTVVEPRLTPTPATIVNPLTGLPDAGDVQDSRVLYASFATQYNTVEGLSGRVFVSRSTDLGETFDPFIPVSPTLAGQSEAQLRPSPDGSSALVLWMGEQRPGDLDSMEAMFSIANAVQLADLGLSAAAEPFPAGSQRTATLSVLNHGTGVARGVVVSGTLPAGLVPIGISEPPTCSITGPTFRCAMPEIGVDASRTISMTVTSATPGSYRLSVSASSDYLDANASDNSITFEMIATAPLPAPPITPNPEPEPSPTPLPTPLPVPEPAPVSSGGGCSTAPNGAPFDPTLLLLACLGLVGPARRCAWSARKGVVVAMACTRAASESQAPSRSDS